MGDLYDADVFEWSQHQARLLRQHAAGEAGTNAPDWPNIIDEIEAVGRGQLSRVRVALVRSLVLDLMCEAWPLSPQVPQWRADARSQRGDAAEAFTPAMRGHIDMDALYRRALAGLPDSYRDQPPLPLPVACPASLDELLTGEA